MTSDQLIGVAVILADGAAYLLFRALRRRYRISRSRRGEMVADLWYWDTGKEVRPLSPEVGVNKDVGNLVIEGRIISKS